MKVATYTRISTYESFSRILRRHPHCLAAYAESQDWQIVRRFTDQKSGATLSVRNSSTPCARRTPNDSTFCCVSRRPPRSLGSRSRAKVLLGAP